MAYGLRTINNRYTPHGNGRDYFFIGDCQYEYGRRTPDPNLRSRCKMDVPPSMPRGKPRMTQFPLTTPSKGILRAPAPPFAGEKLPEAHCSIPEACPASTHIERWRAYEAGPLRGAIAPSGYEFDESHLKQLMKQRKESLRRSGSSPAGLSRVSHASGVREGYCGRDGRAVESTVTPMTTSYQDFGRFQNFDESRVTQSKYKNFSARCFPPERPGQAEVGQDYSQFKLFDESKLTMSKYSNFSEDVEKRLDKKVHKDQ
eukprot:TRINITY_DN20070_c4_g1_i1.p1 TRINITY_DN20070_c4_g1~~TRINITY_DN20070_c4_g1_i1.p1  ORF type:complete len:258 (-),score=29.47 TRINITY_DN20070_c4_g1_i1:133-906(-)